MTARGLASTDQSRALGRGSVTTGALAASASAAITGCGMTPSRSNAFGMICKPLEDPLTYRSVDNSRLERG